MTKREVAFEAQDLFKWMQRHDRPVVEMVALIGVSPATRRAWAHDQAARVSFAFRDAVMREFMVLVGPSRSPSIQGGT